MNGYVNFIDGSLVEWDGGYVGCVRSVREVAVGKNEYFIE